MSSSRSAPARAYRAEYESWRSSSPNEPRPVEDAGQEVVLCKMLEGRGHRESVTGRAACSSTPQSSASALGPRSRIRRNYGLACRGLAAGVTIAHAGPKRGQSGPSVTYIGHGAAPDNRRRVPRPGPDLHPRGPAGRPGARPRGAQPRPRAPPARPRPRRADEDRARPGRGHRRRPPRHGRSAARSRSRSPTATTRTGRSG